MTINNHIKQIQNIIDKYHYSIFFQFILFANIAWRYNTPYCLDAPKYTKLYIKIGKMGTEVLYLRDSPINILEKLLAYEKIMVFI